MTYYISQGRVEALIKIGGALMLQFCCKFTSVSVCQKNCQNTMRFDKVIAKIKGAIFLPCSVEMLT